MNSLILLPGECEDGTAIIKGARALYLRETHEVKVGMECRASIYGGKRGRARIVDVSRDEVRLDYVMNEEPLKRTQCIVIIAIPRPQTVKKILQISSTMGVEELHFIQTENTEKSYLKSKALNEEEMRDEIIKGLEQSFDSLPPLVSIHPKYWQFKKHVLAGLMSRWAKKRAFLLETKGASRFHLGEIDGLDHVILAIGPESGWTSIEINDFEDAGFQTLSLGERVLRVEHAFAFALSRIEYVRNTNADKE